MKTESSQEIELGAVFRWLLLLFFVAWCSSIQGFSQTNGIIQAGFAPLPPMGWASWNYYFCDYDEKAIRDQANALISTGMKNAGYDYVLIQGCIAQQRDGRGNLIASGARFPSGMPALTAYIHKLGLKAGIYTDVGTLDCSGGSLGSYNHEVQDAKTFADWGMDFIEEDYCFKPPDHTGVELYGRMAEAIRKTGRPMLLYICSWGNESPWLWAQGVAQLWRTDADISPKPMHVDWAHLVNIFESNAKHAAFSAPNGWNDPDMLEVGNQGLSDSEARTHFSMWAISAAPLWAGNDLTRMSPSILSIYTNSEVIAVDQDPLGAGVTRIRGGSGKDSGLEVWSKPLGSIGSGDSAVLLLNLTSDPADVSVQWKDLELRGKANVRDLWAHRNLGSLSDGYTADIPAHGSVMLKVSGEFSWTEGATYEAEWPGNVRSGKTAVIACPDCSQNYAVSLDGARKSPEGGSLCFTHIVLPESGTYRLKVFYAYNGSDRAIDVQANDGGTVSVPINTEMYAPVETSVQLHQGNNSILVSFAGSDSVNIDKIRVFQDRAH